MLIKINNIEKKNIHIIQNIKADIYSSRLEMLAPTIVTNIEFLKEFIELYGEKACIEIHIPSINTCYIDSIIQTLDTLSPMNIELHGHHDAEMYVLGNEYIDKCNVILSGIVADHDSDPSWILYWNSQLKHPKRFIYEIELLKDLDDPFSYLEAFSNFENEGITMQDVTKLTTDYSVLLNVDITTKNIFSFIRSIPLSLGISINASECDFCSGQWKGFVVRLSEICALVQDL